MTNYMKAVRDESHPHHREAKRLARKFITDTDIDDEGVVRWKSNGQVPPAEILDLWQALGCGFVRERTDAAHEADLDRFLAEYREARKNGPSSEERMEAGVRGFARALEAVGGSA